MLLRLPDKSMNWGKRLLDLVVGQVDRTFELSYQPRRGNSMAVERSKSVAMTANERGTNARGKLRTNTDLINGLSHDIQAQTSESKETSSKLGCCRFKNK